MGARAGPCQSGSLGSPSTYNSTSWCPLLSMCDGLPGPVLTTAQTTSCMYTLEHCLRLTAQKGPGRGPGSPARLSRVRQRVASNPRAPL